MGIRHQQEDKERHRGGVELARQLAAEKESIIGDWTGRLKVEVPSAKGVSRPILVDSVPEWIDRLAAALSASDEMPAMSRISIAAREHGRQRTSMDYELSELLYEYAVLRRIIFEHLEKGGPILPRYRDVILDAVQRSMREAAMVHTSYRSLNKRHSLLNHGQTTFGVRMGISVGTVILATMLQAATWQFLKPYSYFLYYPAIILAALMGGDGRIAIVLSTLAAQYFFIDPIHTFKVEDWTEAVQILIFVATAYFITRVAENLRAAQAIAEATLEDQESARRHAESAAEEARESKAQAENTVEALNRERELRDHLVAAISHDLRGPLVVVKANAQLLKRRSFDEDFRRVLYSRIEDGVDRANRMIEDLLDANRVRAGQLITLSIVRCDLVELAQNLIEELSVVHGRRFVLQCPKEISGYWDRQALHRVLENLCNNAIKYGAPDQPIALTLASDGPTAEVSVHNSGSYISDDDRQRLFKPYQRTSSAERSGKKGWGIGLTIVQGLVQAHGGCIKVESDRVKGTTFLMVLPTDSRPFQS